VLGLQCRERMHSVGAADRGGAGLGQADVADFAYCDEISKRAESVLDGRVRVDAVLVVEVDVVSGEKHRLERARRWTGCQPTQAP
jgi:hypothetical protein